VDSWHEKDEKPTNSENNSLLIGDSLLRIADQNNAHNFMAVELL
jgi:hypothetical protein